MKTTEMNLKDALDVKTLLSLGYEYIWAMEISSVKLQKLENIDLHPDELIEARIFNHDHEIHIFEYEDELKAIETVTEPTDVKVTKEIPDISLTHYHERKQLLREKYGKTITLRDFIDYDEDGMAYIAHTVLCDVGGVR